MSSLYKNLSDEDFKIEKESLRNLEKKMQEPPQGAALKGFVIGAFILSIVSLVGSAYLYQSLNKEKRQREALEAAQIQIREKAASFEQAAEKNQSEMERLGEQIKSYSSLRQEIAEQLAESRQEVTSLRTRLKEIEEKSLAMREEAEEIQTDFESMPVGPELSDDDSTAAEEGVEASEGTADEKEQEVEPVFNEPTVIQEPQILSVNKKFNFVVANIGLKSNVEIGDTLNVVRDGQTIGSATVEKVYDNFSAATINEQPKDAPFKQGDTVSKA
jgi:hypothetical protein